ncbi:unnamed protein product [Adineta steineri]|uniref:Secreted protein n=1 Tax=Adineta steineri TaxID=433720 RepID=A0A813YKK2_9BILA|nr:unnamed protein product [Adineta steineri]CAF1158960.1 unnamed protein product [Adineta steineri]
MMTFKIKHIIQLFSIVLLLNIICAATQAPSQRRVSTSQRRASSVSSNQRSTDSGYKYAWFTRDIHDDINSDEGNNDQQLQLSPQTILRMKILKSIYNRKYQDSDATSSESNEDR